MKGEKYILLKSKIPVWLKYWFYKKGGVTPTLKNLYLGYSRQERTTGKNLMPLSSYNASEQRQKVFNIGLPVGTYTISYNLDSFELGTNTFFNIFISLRGEDSVVLDQNIITINSSTETGRKTVTITLSEDVLITKDSNIRISGSSYDNGARASISNIQIEAGTVATPYEPYTGGIPAPNPEYPFEIENITGNVAIQAGNKIITFPLTEGQKIYAESELTPNGIKYTRKQIVLNGTEEGWVLATSENNFYYRYRYIQNRVEKNSNHTIDLCNRFRSITIANTNTNTGFYIITTGEFRCRFGEQKTIADFKLWLSENPLIIEYELAEPETVSYTDAQLQAYTNLCKYFEENTDLNNYIVGG